MFKNAFVNFLEKYDDSSYNQQVKLAQQLEEELAADQQRKPRAIVPYTATILDEMITGKKLATHYNSETPGVIYYNVNGECAIYSAYNLIHASFEAYLDDFSKGLANLQLFSSDYLEDEILASLAVEPKIKKYITDHNKPEYENGFIKNALGHKETCMYIMDKVISSIETPEDLEKYKYSVFDVMYGYIDSIICLENAKNLYNTSYSSLFDQFYQEVTDEKFTNATHLANAGSVTTDINPKINKTFNQTLKYAHAYIYSDLNEGKYKNYDDKQIQELQEKCVAKLTSTLFANFKFKF